MSNLDNKDTNLIDNSIKAKQLEISVALMREHSNNGPVELPYNPVLRLKQELRVLLDKRDAILEIGNVISDINHSQPADWFR